MSCYFNILVEFCGIKHRKFIALLVPFKHVGFGCNPQGSSHGLVSNRQQNINNTELQTPLNSLSPWHQDSSNKQNSHFVIKLIFFISCKGLEQTLICSELGEGQLLAWMWRITIMVPQSQHSECLNLGNQT